MQAAQGTSDMQVIQRGYEILLVSQFTLYSVMKGNKPDFHLSMPPAEVQLSLSLCCTAIFVAVLSVFLLSIHPKYSSLKNA